MNKTQTIPTHLLPNLAYGATFDSPADMLANAVDVLTFLSEVAPYLAEGGGNLAISEPGAIGLATILNALGNTITTAIDLIPYNPRSQTGAQPEQEARP